MTREMMSIGPVTQIVDLKAAEKSMSDFLRALGVDLEKDKHLEDTPKRIVKMYREMLKGYDDPEWEFTTFDKDKVDEMIVVKDIQFVSLCAHHALTFKGKAHVGYLPDSKIAGLSKLARTVKYFSRRLQVQERLTWDIAEFLQEKLKPLGLGVVMEAEHDCMSVRGVQSPGHMTITSALLGNFKEAPVKSEFLRFIGK